MIKIVYRNEINVQLWDSFIEQSLQRNIYVLSWFLNLTPKAWGAVIKFDSSMNYAMVLPFQIRSKYGFKIIHQEPAVNELGFYSLTDADPTELLEKLKSEFRYISRYYLNTKNYLTGSPDLTFKLTYHLDLNVSYDVIAKSYNTNKKRNLKKAESKNISIVENDDIEVLIDLFKENVAHKIYGLRPYQYTLLRKIQSETKKRNMSFILQAKSEKGEILSSALFIKYFNRLTYYFAASSNLGLKNSSQTLLIDSVIRKFSETDLILDFEGGSIEGMNRFYGGFGAKPLKIYSLQQLNIPYIIKSILLLRSKLIKIVIRSIKRK